MSNIMYYIKRIFALRMLALVLLGISSLQKAQALSYTFTDFDHPDYVAPIKPDPSAVYGTDVTGVSGSIVVGSYTDSNGDVHGYRYNGVGFLKVEDPKWSNVNNEVNNGTAVTGVEGVNLVGIYSDKKYNVQGFIFDLVNFTTISHPSAAKGTWVSGISGSTVCGDYRDSSKSIDYGFTYNYIDRKFTNVSHPQGVYGTWVAGISKNTIFGCYIDKNLTRHGFIRRGGNFTDVDVTNAAKGKVYYGTEVTGISGDTTVGYYYDDNGKGHGFVLNNGIFYSVDARNAKYLTPNPYYNQNGTEIHGISGDVIYGCYTGVNGILHGFTATPTQQPAPTLGNFSISSKAYGSAPFTLTAPTSPSSGAWSYTSSSPSVATVSGNTITIKGVGSTTITATQAAKGNYTSAYKTANFTVTAATPNLGSFSVASKVLGSAAFTLTAPTSPSIGAWSYTSSSPSVATVSGNKVTIKGVGSTTITATQAANGNYTSASKTTTFTVTTERRVIRRSSVSVQAAQIPYLPPLPQPAAPPVRPIIRMPVVAPPQAPIPYILK